MTVLIGIAVRGEPVAGVIHRPFSKKGGEGGGEDGHTYWGLKGLGTRGIRVGPTQPFSATEDMRMVFTRSHYTDLIRETEKALSPREALMVGGCGHKTMMVVEGKVDAYVFPSLGTKKWDSCAGDALVRAVGGLMTDVRGELLRYDSWEEYRNRMGLVVSMHRNTHQMIIEKIPQEVKEALALQSKH